MNGTLYIVRGLPGSGKTTFANKLGCLVLSPWDMYVMRSGDYRFHDFNTDEHRKRKKDVFDCILKTAFKAGMDVAIAEVLPKREHVARYTDMMPNNYQALVFDMPCTIEQSLERNTHKVPEAVIRSMAASFESWHTTPKGPQ